jgi:hypothetical protein
MRIKQVPKSERRKKCSESCLFITQLCLQSVFFLSLFSLYTTTLFIMLSGINTPAIINNQSNHSYHSYTVALIA